MNDAAPPSWLDPVLVTTYPLREPSARLAAKLEARVAAGFRVDGLDHPRGYLWAARVLPLAILDGIALIVLIAFGVSSESASAIALSASAVALLSAVALATIAYVRADPLRLTDDERRELAQVKTWRSDRPWNPTYADTPSRALLSRAMKAVEAIVTIETWRSSALQNHRTQLDLKAELDAIDAQAFALASGGEPAALVATLDERVRALEIYESALRTLGPSPQLVHDETLAISRSVRDEFATDHLKALTADLEGRADQTYQ